MAAAYQWGYRGAMIVAGRRAAGPGTNATTGTLSYAVMAALMLIGVRAVLWPRASASTSVRAIPTGDLPERPVFGAVEWAIRLAIVAVRAGHRHGLTAPRAC
jgi:PAT family beta-lactamase induction signal transducer AmpG